MTSTAQRRLAKVFSRVTMLGPPMGDRLTALVDHLFDPDEAELAAALPLYRTQPIEEIAQRAGRDVEDIRPMLQGMADRAVIYESRKGYSLLPLVPGMFEFLLLRGDMEEWYRRSARMFLDLFSTGYVADYTGTQIPAVRPIPVGKAYRKRTHTVDDDAMEAMLEAHEHFGVLNACMCRHANALAGKPCKTASPDDGCLTFGSFGRKSISEGRGRDVSRDEMRAIIEDRRARKLVLLTANVSPSNSNAICTCCECCCHLLETINDHDARGWVAPPRFLVEVDEQRCDHCGLCKPACSTRAHTVSKKVHTYHRKRCIGCGNCVDVCRPEAISLEPNPAYRQAPADFDKLVKKLLPPIAWAMIRAKVARMRGKSAMHQNAG